MKLLNYLLPVIFILTVASSCNKDDNPSDSSGDTNTLTMSHWGVDWSEGQTASADLNNPNFRHDGETIGWCTFGQWINGLEGVWYRPFNDKMYRVGSGSLSDISQLDTTRWSADVCATPLVKDDIWAASCSDGYVIFKVTETPDPNSQDWECDVEYVFSSTINF